MAEASDIKMLPSTIVEKLEEAGITEDSLIFYQNDRWVYQVVKDKYKSTPSICQKMNALGPFDVHSVDVSLILFPSTFEYSVTKIGTQSFSNVKHMTSVYAPIVPITLEGFARTTANIPNNATHFCWLYPLRGILDNGTVNLDHEYEKNLLRIGGFAYFIADKNNSDALQPIRVNSLMASTANGIQFDGPYEWPEEFTERLWEKNRFQPVTLPNLLEKGVRYFAFINPYESVPSENGHTSWIPSPHGAFAYLFNEDHSPHKFDCYFTVTDDCLGVSPESDNDLLSGDIRIF